MKGNPTRPRLSVTTGGKGVVAHAGARLLCDLADEVGLTAGLSAAMAPSKCRRRGWDRGRVLVDLAVALADGAKTISDLRALRNQPGLFGEVASTPTAWRTLEAVDDHALDRIATARAVQLEIIDGTRRAGPMQHEVDGALDVDIVGDVVFDEGEIAVRQVRDVRRVPREQVVDADDGIVAIEECLGEVRSDEPGRTSNDDALFHRIHGWRPTTSD